MILAVSMPGYQTVKVVITSSTARVVGIVISVVLRSRPVQIELKIIYNAIIMQIQNRIALCCYLNL